MDKNRKAQIDAVVKEVKKEYGEGALMFGVDMDRMAPKYISTGSVLFDMALGGNGLLRGGITQFFGPKKQGKTTACCAIVANAQEDGLLCAYLAPEKLDIEYAESLGVNIDELIMNDSEDKLTAEQWLELFRRIVRRTDIDIIVVDSVAALVPQAEFADKKNPDRTLENDTVAALARVMSKALRIINTEITKRDKLPVIIFTNHLRSKIGVVFGSPETRPGGHALDHYSNLIVRITRAERIKKEGEIFDSKKMEWIGGEEEIGIKIKIKVVEGRVAGPREQFVEIYFSGGFDVASELFAVYAIERKIEKSGSRWKFAGEDKSYYKNAIQQEILRRESGEKQREEEETGDDTGGQDSEDVGMADKGSKSEQSNS